MKPLVCLMMIVKDEEAILARCLERVRPFLDRWVIVDTGSTDKTKEVALKALEGIPGKLVTHEWKNYADARNVALRVAEDLTANQVAYGWQVDADDIWEGKLDKSQLTLEGHGVWFVQPARRVEINGVEVVHHPSQFLTTRFLKLGMGWRYEYVVHETPVCDAPCKASLLEGLTVMSPSDGATYRDPEKHLKRAKMISEAMVDDPANPRYAFFLAQSYRDHEDFEKAAALYLKRAAMGPGSNSEEVYLSYLEAGRAFSRLERLEEAQKAFLSAHQANPGRREAMWELGELFLIKSAMSPNVGTDYVENIPNSFQVVVNTEHGPVTVIACGAP